MCSGQCASEVREDFRTAVLPLGSNQYIYEFEQPFVSQHSAHANTAERTSRDTLQRDR